MEGLLRLYPVPAEETSAEGLYADLVFPGPSPPDRLPHVAINMVMTLDGKVSVGGKASPIGSDADRTVMRNIRCAVDAVLVGAGTVRAEEMNLSVPRELQEKRNANGLPNQPLGVILAGASNLPLDRKVFSHTTQRVIVIAGATTPDRTLSEASRLGIPTIRTESPRAILPEPREVLSLLKAHFGVRNVLLEGGPSVNGAFLASGAVDELFLTLSPKISLSPTDGPTIASNPVPQPPTKTFDLVSTHAYPPQGELYLRYLRQKTTTKASP